MRVLIVESSQELAKVWQRHLTRLGHEVQIVHDQRSAIAYLQTQSFPVIVLDVVLEYGSALAVADFASYRQPDARIVFVTNSTFFTDGSIFNLCGNACAFLPSATAPQDLAVMVEHYAR